jgi:hypothetical protein
MLSNTQVTVCKDQISYMQSRDSNALEVQRHMVAAISTIGQGLQQRRHRLLHPVSDSPSGGASVIL